MTGLVNIVRLRAPADRSEALGAALATIVGPTQEEPGCTGYMLHRDAEDKAVWMVYESWRDPAALDAHLAQPYVQELIPRLGDLLDGPIESQSYAPVTP